MSNLNIYNTNSSQVYSQGQKTGGHNSSIKAIIGNAIEYYADTRQGLVVALVSAKAPHVKGRDKANFHVEFVDESSTNLANDFVAELEKLARQTDWEFHKDEQKKYTPWLIASSDVESPDDLNLNITSLFTVRRLVENGKSLDFGFQGYEQAARAISYFLNQNGLEARYAIASNSRRGPIQQAELVLEPDCKKNFDILTKATRHQIATKSEKLREETESYYHEQTLENVEGLAGNPELSPVQALEELHQLQQFADAGITPRNHSHSFWSEQANTIIERIEAVKNNERVDDAPNPSILDQSTRSDIITKTQGAIEDQRATLVDNISDRVMEKVDDHLDDLSSYAPVQRIEYLSVLHNKIGKGPVDIGSNHREPVDSVLELADQIENTNLLDHSKKNQITDEMREEIGERISEIQAQEEDRVRDEMQSWIRGLPPLRTNLATSITESVDRLNETIRNPDSTIRTNQTLSNASISFNALEAQINDNQAITEEAQSRLQHEFTERLANYAGEVRSERKKKIRDEIDDATNQLQNGTLQKDEVEILSQRQAIFSSLSRSIPEDLERFEEIVKDIEDESIFSEDDKTNLKRHMRSELRDRERAIRQQEKERLESRLEYLREQTLDSLLNGGNRSDAIDFLNIVQKFVDNRVDESELPNQIKHAYRRKLRIIAGQKQHDVLESDDISEVKSRLAESRTESVKELREEELEEVKTAFDRHARKLETRMNNDLVTCIRVFKTLQRRVNRKGGSGIDRSSIPDVPRRAWEWVEKLQQLADKTIGDDAVFTHNQQARLWQELQQTLESYRETVEENLLADRVDRISDFLRSEYTVEDNSLEEIEESLESLETVKSTLHGGRDTSELPDRVESWVNEMMGDLVDQSRTSEFRERTTAEIKELTEDLEQKKYELLRNRIESKLREINDSDDSFETKMRRLQNLSAVINPETTLPDSDFDTKFIERCHSVSENLRGEYDEVFGPRIRNLTDSVLDDATQDIISELNNTLENTDHPGTALETFELYINENVSIGKNNELRDVCDTFATLIQLRDDQVITKDQFERVRKNILTEVSEAHQEYETDSKLRSIARDIKSMLK